jgi:hypothetical protein
MLWALMHQQPIPCAAAESLVLAPHLLDDPAHGQLCQQNHSGR